MWNLPSPINITQPESPSIGDVHPSTSPFDLGLVYGSYIFVNPLSFSKSCFTLTSVVLNYTMPIRCIS